MNEEEILKKHYDKENIFQSVKKAMQEFSNQQNQSLTDQLSEAKKEIERLHKHIEMLTNIHNSSISDLQSQLEEKDKEIQASKDMAMKFGEFLNLLYTNRIYDGVFLKLNEWIEIGGNIQKKMTTSELLNSEEFKNYLNKK